MARVLVVLSAARSAVSMATSCSVVKATTLALLRPKACTLVSATI